LDKDSISKEEAKLAFRDLLRDKGMTVNWTQEQALQTTRDDPRWKLLTAGEKKNVIQLYMQDLKREERDERIKKIKQQEEDFIQMLFDCEQIKKESSFREAMTLVSTDPRFLGVSTDIDRERLFDEFLNRRARKEREEDRMVRDNLIDDYKNFLMNNPKININSQWREFQDTLAKGEPAFENLNKLDRLKIFTDYIKKLETDEEEKHREEKFERRRKDRQYREEYRLLLREYLEKGHINVKTKWKEFKVLIENEKRYLDILDTLGSTPAAIFYDIVEELEEEYRKEKKNVKEILKEQNIMIDKSTPWEVYDQALNGYKEKN